MTTVKSNIWNLEVGDELHFTNSVNTQVKLKVRRLTDSSCYLASSFGDNLNTYWGEDFHGGRNSFGTVQSFTKYPDFKIIKK